jgi:hypothetical protein
MRYARNSRPPPDRFGVDFDRATASRVVDGGASAWAETAGRRLERDGVLTVRLSKLGLDRAAMRDLAVAAVTAIRAALVTTGLPPSTYIEPDRPQATEVTAGARTRTLLPHHDGGHCSYLTPSTEHVPDFHPRNRTFADQGFCTTTAHKLYQGIFVAEPGEGRSVTTYYPWARLVQRAHARVLGRPGTLYEVARWLGDNVSSARRESTVSGARYPSIAASLGSASPGVRALAPHCAEADLDPETLRRYPELQAAASACPCGACRGPAERVFCAGLSETLGLTWTAVRRHFEVEVHTQQFDLVVGHNLVLVHGGADGGPSRVLEPISIVMDEPAGEDYEAWLAREWERWTRPVSSAHRLIDVDRL